MVELLDIPLDAETVRTIQADPVLSAWCQARLGDVDSGVGLWNFKPRPDRPELFDEQSSFIFNRDPVSFLMAGNAAGKTEAGACKAAKFLLEWQPPPRKDTPFWVCSDSYEQVMSVCWLEKLVGHSYLPECEIDYKRISWHSEKRGYPKAVPLRPWPGRPGKNWQLEFRSYDQGHEAFRARSIGGFWFSEQFPPKIMEETLRGCRDYLYSGGQFAEFTPTDPELCVWLQDKLDDPPPGWKFYRCNTACNKPNLADGWFDQFYSFIPDEMVATRMTGELAWFEGAIYQGFDRSIHVHDFDCAAFPCEVYHARGLDWGHKHPFYCVWGYRTAEPAWYIYDELWSNDQNKITEDYAAEVKQRSEDWGYPRPGIQDIFHGPVYCDPSRPGDIAAFGRYEVWATGANNDVFRGIDCVRSFLKPQQDDTARLHIHPRCVRLIEGLRRYRWDPKKAQVPKPLKVDDDAVDGARYLLYSDSLRPNERPATADYRPTTTRHSVRFNPNHENKLGYGFKANGGARR